ncbi:hypothetical protein SCUCBS95973_005624 [Sporothrix curviconia]|uniref:Uncharacterized protein n=1 Tax=Sporothrix curviconia TaxID=1260050 RepID=A0ABP0BYS4_9PEZI
MEHNDPPPPYRLEEEAESKAAAAASTVLASQGIPLSTLSSRPRRSSSSFSQVPLSVVEDSPQAEPRPTTTASATPSSSSSSSSSGSSGYSPNNPMMAEAADPHKAPQCYSGSGPSTAIPI